MPSVLSVVLLMFLPWSKKVGLLCAFYVNHFSGAPSYAIAVSWVAVTTSGHTKVRSQLFVENPYLVQTDHIT